MDALDNDQVLSEDKVTKLLGVERREGIADYRRFLSSAAAIEVEGHDWRAKSLTRDLAVALRNEDIPTLRELLRSAPSFADFERRMQETPIGKPYDPTDLGRAARTYLTLGEVTQIGAPIFGEGFYPTPSSLTRLGSRPSR